MVSSDNLMNAPRVNSLRRNKVPLWISIKVSVERFHRVVTTCSHVCLCISSKKKKKMGLTMCSYRSIIIQSTSCYRCSHCGNNPLHVNSLVWDNSIIHATVESGNEQSRTFGPLFNIAWENNMTNVHCSLLATPLIQSDKWKLKKKNMLCFFKTNKQGWRVYQASLQTS